jgi:hypothetical protein
MASVGCWACRKIAADRGKEKAAQACAVTADGHKQQAIVDAATCDFAALEDRP